MIAPLPICLAAALAALAPLSACADTATKCPLIRPSGLGDDDVDRVVLRDYAVLLQRSPDQVDVKLTPSKLDGTANTQLYLLFAALAVRDDLGVDVLPGMTRIAAGRGSQKLEDVVTVAEIQAEARKLYDAGKDSPPPDAIAGASYKLQGIQVSTPRPATGWQLLQCGSDKVTFRHASIGRGPMILATSRLGGLPSWHDEDRFRSDVARLLRSTVPAGLQVTSSNLELVKRPTRPCAEFSVVGSYAGAPYELLGRTCYAFDNDNPLGYMTMVSFTGAVPGGEESAQAREFIENASPH